MDIAEVNAGAHAAAVVSLLLAKQAMGGAPDHVRVQVGIYDSSLSMIEIAVQTRILADLFGDATSDIIANRLGDPFACRDGGLIGVNLYGKDVWARMCDVMGTPEHKADERFIETVSRWANGPALREILDAWCVTVDRDEAMVRLRQFLIPAAPIIACKELLEQEQVIRRGIVAVDGAHARGSIGSAYVIDGERTSLSYMTPSAMIAALGKLALPGLVHKEVGGTDYVATQLQ
jgi:crotonobetainyl-CoA:carnitine CoA-transferase CaiB-like acyl-CoA transferase